MPIYHQLNLLKPENIIIDSFEGPAYRIGDLFSISNKDSLDEQVLSLLHELIHGFPEFKGKSLGKNNRDEEIEAKIEALAKEIYTSRPLICVYLKKKIKEAGKNPKNQIQLELFPCKTWSGRVN